MPRKRTRKSMKRQADTLFTNYIRRDGVCERCGRSGIRMECSHIFSRRFLVTRWLDINALCLCSACHRWWHNKPVEGVEWVKEHLSEDVYNELRRIAKTSVKKVDLEEVIEDLQNKLHEL